MTAIKEGERASNGTAAQNLQKQQQRRQQQQQRRRPKITTSGRLIQLKREMETKIEIIEASKPQAKRTEIKEQHGFFATKRFYNTTR